MPEIKKSNIVKIVVGLLVAAASGAGADAAGYVPDPAALKDLGILGSLLLIGYIEYRAMPVLLRIAKLDPAKAQAAEVAPVDTVVEEQPKRRASTHPQLVAVRPHEDPR